VSIGSLTSGASASAVAASTGIGVVHLDIVPHVEQRAEPIDWRYLQMQLDSQLIRRPIEALQDEASRQILLRRLLHDSTLRPASAGASRLPLYGSNSP
jgi:hypothetical protein